MKRGYDEVLGEYWLCAYDETNEGSTMTQHEELNEDQKKLNWLLGLEKETLANMAHQQSKIIERLQKATKAQTVPEGWKLVPVEPTEEMVDAFIDSDIDIDPEQNVIIGYKAMLAAAPEIHK